MGIPRKGGQYLAVIYSNQLGKSDGISSFQCGNQRLATMVRRAFEVGSLMQISLNAVWSVIATSHVPGSCNTISFMKLKYCVRRHPSEKISTNKYLKRFLDASESLETSANLSVRAYFRQFSDW